LERYGGFEMKSCRKISLAIFLTACMLLCSGCNLLEGLASDVQGWDISACVDGFGTCFELWKDNADKFDDAFSDALGTITER